MGEVDTKKKKEPQINRNSRLLMVIFIAGLIIIWGYLMFNEYIINGNDANVSEDEGDTDEDSEVLIPDVEEWEIYENALGYGFRIKYPQNAKLNTPEECYDRCTNTGQCSPCFDTEIVLSESNYPVSTLQIESLPGLGTKPELLLNSISNYSWVSEPVQGEILVGGIPCFYYEGEIDLSYDESKKDIYFGKYIVVDAGSYVHTISWWDDIDRSHEEYYENLVDSISFSSTE
ncbi:hypothetical protein JW887_02190 [Candidatus Dojkabacteria bacterium]|nr:hypothetical protein [Candidatus Dojkabacteria bacterium]